MNRPQNPNLQILSLAVDQLGELANEMVFLGGCATGLLISDLAAPPIRVTMDVDTIVDVSTRTGYYQLAEKLRQRHFKEDTSDDAPICRWLGVGVILDVMPIAEEILGFGSAWHQKAMLHHMTFKLSDAQEIRMVSPPYFLITKLEAFNGRGKGDYQQSHDMEDVIAILDGRPELFDEVQAADADLKGELAGRFQQLLADMGFVNAVAGHLPPDAASQTRARGVIEKLRKISEL
jgi:hypothetical protein